MTLVVRACWVLLPDGERAATVRTADGRITAVTGFDDAPAGAVTLADADVLPLLREVRAEGVRVTVETCPHHLTFAAEEVPDGDTACTCCPPIREFWHREALWAAPADGDGGQPVIDMVVSDHSPCTPELKRLDVGDFGLAWGGIASLQGALPAVWTGARGARTGPVAGRPLDVGGPGAAGRAAAEGGDRGRAGRRPGGVRAGGAVAGGELLNR